MRLRRTPSHMSPFTAAFHLCYSIGCSMPLHIPSTMLKLWASRYHAAVSPLLQTKQGSGPVVMSTPQAAQQLL